MYQFEKQQDGVEEQCEGGGDCSDNEILQIQVEQIKKCFPDSRHWSMRSLASIRTQDFQRSFEDEEDFGKVWSP